MKPEEIIQEGILSFLEIAPGYYYRQKTVGTFSKEVGKYLLNPQHTTGVSDILGIYPDGRFVAIEVKTPENKKRPEEQVKFVNNINRNNGIALFATSKEEIMELFDELALEKIAKTPARPKGIVDIFRSAYPEGFAKFWTNETIEEVRDYIEKLEKKAGCG